VDSHLRASEENLYIREKDLVVVTEKGGENFQASAASDLGYSSFLEFCVQVGQAGGPDPGAPTLTSVLRTPFLRYPRGTTTGAFTTTVRVCGAPAPSRVTV